MFYNDNLRLLFFYLKRRFAVLLKPKQLILSDRWGIILSCIFLTTMNLLGGEIIGEWNFEDNQNPGKATIGIDAIVKGRPTIVIDQSRKALQLHGAVNFLSSR